jgi:DNA replication and repair protein RecF
LFSPQDLEIIIGTPSLRRNFLDDVLEQIDREYRVALLEYSKALRQRNALLSLAKDTGRRKNEQFEYWDELLILNGQIITKKREELINKINAGRKDIFDLQLIYDKSTISKERLLQYEDAELGSGVTLVGPHRDDFYINIGRTENDIRSFGSRGQQRLAILQLKILQLNIIEEALQKKPILLLDDIFSELDASHIDLVWSLAREGQTIITTTHAEFKPKKMKDIEMIELGK